MVKKRTLSDIICQNTDYISELPPNVFRYDNEPISCNDESRSELDFEAIVESITSKNEHEAQDDYTSPSYSIGIHDSGIIG